MSTMQVLAAYFDTIFSKSPWRLILQAVVAKIRGNSADALPRGRMATVFMIFHLLFSIAIVGWFSLAMIFGIF